MSPDAGSTFRAAARARCRQRTRRRRRRPCRHASRFSISTRSSRSARSRASAATAPRWIRSRATASPAASRSRCSTRRRMKLIKTIDVGAAQPDGIYFDAFNERVYVFSHPTKDATVIDSKDGTVLGTIDLGGVPEQGVGRRQGHALRRHAGCGRQRHRRRRQDDEGDRRTIRSATRAGATALRSTSKNSVLFAACGRSGNPPAQPAAADDGDPQRRGRQDPREPAARRRLRRRRVQPATRWKRSARTATAR